MAHTWFRLHDEVVDDPKVQRLSPILFKAWINMMCLCSKNGGTLPSLDDIAFRLRTTKSRANELLIELLHVGLFEYDDDGQAVPHNWHGRQFQSDVSTERVKRFRKKNETPDETVNETFHETKDETPHIHIQNRTDTETDTYTHGKFKNVKLSQSEHESLIEKFSAVGAEERINALSEYIASKPTKYKSHYAVILMWERKNGAKHNGNMDKGERNAETARRLLSRLHSQDSGSVPRDPARNHAGSLSRASAEALFGADTDGDSTHN